MHTATQLESSLFSVKFNGAASSREDLFPEWLPHDRLGVVVTEPFGAIGTSHLIQLAITAFYDARPDRRAAVVERAVNSSPNAIYPEIYLFHVGGRYGDHSWFDFWPARKEVFVDRHPPKVLDAINDRGITRLAVPDARPTAVEHEFKEPAAARDRIVTALGYSATGRVSDPTWEVAGLSARTEANILRILDPDRRYVAHDDAAQDGDPDLEARSWPTITRARLSEAVDGLEVARARREAIRNAQGLAEETYRQISVDEALEMLV